MTTYGCFTFVFVTCLVELDSLIRIDWFFGRNTRLSRLADFVWDALTTTSRLNLLWEERSIAPTIIVDSSAESGISDSFY